MCSTSVDVTRTGSHSFTATNPRGGQVSIGLQDASDSFTPGELLLVAIAACSAATSENLLVRRIGDDATLTVHADRTKTKDDPNKFASVSVDFDVDLSAIADETERSKLADAVHRAIQRYCTVSRSVEEGTPITVILPR